VPEIAAQGHRRKLPALFPGIIPRGIAGKVANGIVGEGLTVVGCQQVAPCGITIAIADGIDNRTQAAGGVSVFLLAGDITCLIVSPDPRLPGFLIILTNQLIGRVIDIAGGIWLKRKRYREHTKHYSNYHRMCLTMYTKPQIMTTCGFAGISVDVRWSGYIAMRCLDRLCTTNEIMLFV